MPVKSYREERSRDLKRKILLGNHCAGYTVQQRAKGLAPVDTGLLRASITFEVHPDNGGVDIGVHAGKHPGHPGVGLHGKYHTTAYFCFQELGTRRNSAHPYLVPGLQQSRDHIESCYSGRGSRAKVVG